MARGIREGDRVAYLSFNNHQLLEGYFGVPLARAVVMPLNVRLTPPELIGILNHSGARCLIYEPDFEPLVQQLRASCPSIAEYVTTGEAYEELLSHGRLERPEIMSFDETAIAELFYTSGSTGSPKGVMLSHRTLYLHALSVISGLGLQDTGVELHTIPLFHANGWGRAHTATMLGLTQVMVRRFEPSTVLRLIQEERATAMSLVPTMANALLNAPDVGSWDLSSMRQIFLGGAASSPELIARMEAVFPCPVVAGYGLTETAPVATSAHRKSTVVYADENDRVRRQAMAGWPFPGV
jgi:fatty-acyl-CoA synthase